MKVNDLLKEYENRLEQVEKAITLEAARDDSIYDNYRMKGLITESTCFRVFISKLKSLNEK